MAEARTGSWKLALVAIWLTFSVTLAGWWLVFGLKQIDRITELGGEFPTEAGKEVRKEIGRRHRMMMSEGATLILLLLGGGGALLYYISTELRRVRRVGDFFAAFTHDLKTSLASVRLQAESLEEDLVDQNQIRVVKRLVRDTVRLELQLENSLLLASPDDSSRFLLEPVELSEFFQGLAHQWPDLAIEVEGGATIFADRRAVESIFKNLLQNSVVHGRASRVVVQIDRAAGAGRAVVRVSDDGRGFQGDRAKLGTMFSRHATSSGSGLGLYLASRLSQTMRGEVRFCDVDRGFCVEVMLPESEGA